MRVEVMNEYLSDLPDYIVRREAQKAALAEPLADVKAPTKDQELFQSKEPIYYVQHETFRHRAIILAAANGLTNSDIAEKLGLHVNTVRNTLCQPWAQARVLEEQRSAGRDAIEVTLAKEAGECLKTLSTIRKTARADKDKLAASVYLLNRYLGAPTQSMRIQSNKDVSEMTDAELEETIQREKAARTPANNVIPISEAHG